MAMAQTESTPARLRTPALQLLRRSLGTREELGGKLSRLFGIVRGYADGATLDSRLAQLRDAGIIDEIPNRPQLFAGSVDMVRFWISPAAADYYEKQGINYVFHQVLRFLDEPASLGDPVGFFSTRDGIIGHLMQVVHANPVYDLQLLCMYPDGLDQLETQLEEMMAGTHPRARAILAIVEEADYHERLLEFVRAWRRDPTIPPLVRGNVAGNADFTALAQTFGSLTCAMRYFRKLPDTWTDALWHVLAVTRFTP